MSAARDRFTAHVSSFFDFAYDDVIRWNNASSVTFERADVVALLDDYRGQWLQYLDDFLASSFFNGHSSADLNNIIRTSAISGIDDAYLNVVSRLDQWGQLAAACGFDSALHGAWTSHTGDLTLTIQSKGEILGFDADGCLHTGNVINPAWLGSAYRVVLQRTCGSNSVLISGTILVDGQNDQIALTLHAAFWEAPETLSLLR